MKFAKKNRLFPLKITKPRNTRNDILSGITVALALVPEAIAFAFILEIDPTIGLYAAFMMGLITAIVGGRPGMISGATGAVAVIFAPLVAQQVKVAGMASALGYLFAAVILMGIIQILFGVLRLGKFIRLVPHPVMLGFVNGLAIVIFTSQLKMFPERGGAGYGLLLMVMIGLITLTMAIAHFLPKITKAIPATLAALIVVTGLSLVLNYFGIEVLTVLDFVQQNVPGKETLAASLPTFALPEIPFTVAAFKTILPYAVLAASVGLIESLMTLTLVDELTETRGSGNRECIGQGVANIFNGFFGGMGGCAMIGQSVINIRAGGRGRTSGITAAVTLLLFILFGASLIEVIPLAALVGVMFMVVIGTFEWSSFRVMKQIPKSDALVIVLVSGITVVVDLAIAVGAGIVVSALVFAWKKGQKIYVEREHTADGGLIYKLEGAIFFGSVSSFKELFTVNEDPEQIVIDFQKSRFHDHSSLEAIKFIVEKYREQGKEVQLKNLSSDCRSLLQRADHLLQFGDGVTA